MISFRSYSNLSLKQRVANKRLEETFRPTDCHCRNAIANQDWISALSRRGHPAAKASLISTSHSPTSLLCPPSPTMTCPNQSELPIRQIEKYSLVGCFALTFQLAPPATHQLRGLLHKRKLSTRKFLKFLRSF